MARCQHGFELTIVRCPSCPDQAAIPKRQPTKGHVPDLAGKPCAGAFVVERTPNVKGESRWKCRLPCGHEKIVAGAHLRAVNSRGGNLRCAECTAEKRAGKVPGTAANSRNLEFESEDT